MGLDIDMKFHQEVMEIVSYDTMMKLQPKQPHLRRRPQEAFPNTSQTLSLPDLDSKDFEEEWKIQRHRDACLLDKKFGKWQDQMISKGHNEWNMHDTMTCDHTDLCKKAKFLDPISPPLEYMKHCGVFDAKKTNEYDLCHFYQVGLSGHLLDFPLPHEPATHEQVSKFLLKARALGQPNLIVAHPWDSVTVFSVFCKNCT